MAHQRSRQICNILLQQYISRHFFYKASFIAETSIWLSSPLYLRVLKFDYGLWFLRKPFSVNHAPLSGLLTQCLLLAQRRGRLYKLYPYSHWFYLASPKTCKAGGSSDSLIGMCVSVCLCFNSRPTE